MTAKRCKDHPQRPAPHPGPRCASCHREVTRARRDRAHSKRVLELYGITGEQYWRLYDAQGGRCHGCQRATGARKRLAVDHDHSCCPTLPACGRCVRGLLCGTCNKTLGHFRDDPEAFIRMANYLNHWPSKGVLYVGG